MERVLHLKVKGTTSGRKFSAGLSPAHFEARWLREEQTAIGHPVRLRIRRSQLDNELRQVDSVIGEHLRAAIEAASAHVITAAGGPEVAGVYPLALRVRADLIRHRAIPPTASPTARLIFLEQAWMSIDAAMATLGEIRFGAGQRRKPV